jgi:transposase
MNISTYSEGSQLGDFAAFVALDWGGKKHAWSMQITENGKTIRSRGDLVNSPEAVEQWAADLARRFGGRPIALAIEQVRGAVIAMLSKYAHIVVFPIHPQTLCSYRKGLRPCGPKSDPSDADLLLEFLLRHFDQVRPLRPDTVETRTLRILVEERRKFVDDHTAHTNRLTGWLKQIFPQILGWFDDPGSPLVAKLLGRWPTLEALQKAKPETLRSFFQKNNSRSQARIEERIEQIGKAVPATHDQALIYAGGRVIENLLKGIARLRQTIAELDQAIETRFKQHPDFFIVNSFPGAGPVMAPRLIAALGTDRERFGSASELQCCTGIAPIVVSSGNQHITQWRWSCSQFLRQTIHEWAQHSMGKSEWAKAYYDRQRSNNKSHQAAVRALAFKWLRILYRCWKDRKPYDAALYESRLRSTASQHPIPSKAPEAVKIQWKKQSGFSKLTAVSS